MLGEFKTHRADWWQEKQAGTVNKLRKDLE